MVIETRVISTDIIKPSSPTPKSLQKCKLSFLDQVTALVMTPLIYFYSSNPEIPNSKKTNHLKKSLSETLSTYYPLAGRLVGNLYIDCNDSGVPFFEAEANHNLSLVIINPNPDDLRKLFPNKLTESQTLCLAVQATYFRCGGVAVAVLISHKICDALSFASFVNSWSAVARVGDITVAPVPKFDGAAYFPPQNISGIDFTGMRKEEIASRIFTFPAAKIALLQEMYSGGGQRRPSRVQALSAYIWTRYLSATGMQRDPNKIYTFSQAVNLRTRLDDLPPCEYHFGNFVGVSIATPAAGDGGVELVQKMKGANAVAYEGYMARLKEDGDKGTNLLTELLAKAHESDKFISFMFTSLCGFPVDEADFGWGKPIWVGTPANPTKNVVVFLNSKNGGGIDALIMLSEQDMEKFEADFEVQRVLPKSNL